MVRILGSLVVSTKPFGCFFLKFSCWYFCRCRLITSLAALVHVVLALQLKLKLYWNAHWYFKVFRLTSMPFFCCYIQKSTKSLETAHVSLPCRACTVLFFTLNMLYWLYKKVRFLTYFRWFPGAHFVFVYFTC
jgi:hypothetical protein